MSQQDFFRILDMKVESVSAEVSDIIKGPFFVLILRSWWFRCFLESLCFCSDRLTFFFIFLPTFRETMVPRDHEPLIQRPNYLAISQKIFPFQVEVRRAARAVRTT